MIAMAYILQTISNPVCVITHSSQYVSALSMAWYHSIFIPAVSIDEVFFIPSFSFFTAPAASPILLKISRCVKKIDLYIIADFSYPILLESMCRNNINRKHIQITKNYLRKPFHLNAFVLSSIVHYTGSWTIPLFELDHLGRLWIETEVPSRMAENRYDVERQW